MYKSLHNELRNFHIKFSVKFTTSFQSSRFDWQLRNEIAQFVVNCENFKRTSETVCQKFCETHCKTFLQHIFMRTLQSTYSLNKNKGDQSLPLSWDSFFFPILFLFFLLFPSVSWALPVFPIPGVGCDLLLAFEHNSLLATFSNMFAG